MISSGETMEKVRVKPVDLIEKLRKHFERHKKELAEAVKNYRRKASLLLEERKQRIDKGETLNLSFSIEPPDDHTEDYERAIAMLEMSQDETVTVTAQQFAAFVQDKWNWKNQFHFKNSTYGC